MRLVKIIFLMFFLAAVSVCVCHFSGLRRLPIPDNKWLWIQHVLHDQPPMEVDYAFIGSSRTWCAVRSRQIEEARPGQRIWNLGRHWIGRDIDYLLLEQLLARHRVRHVFVEIIGQEKFAPHAYAKYLVTPENVFEEAGYHLSRLRPADYLTCSSQAKEVTKHLLSYSAELSVRWYKSLLTTGWLAVSGDRHRAAAVEAYEKSGGFYTRDNQVQPRPDFVERYGRFQPFFPVSKGPYLLPPESFPDYYLHRMRTLADRHGTELSFIFISDFGAVLPNNQAFGRYRDMGDVYFPSLRRLYHSELWRDKNHLYGSGAVVLTDEIIRLLEEGAAASEEMGQYVPVVENNVK
ncbi:MAG: hypothetical protein KC900_07540 [Candidatus Omnitrophica bacterium]|nr:hypothetical protein [Candidatus Omnitrophota bacterium]